MMRRWTWAAPAWRNMATTGPRSGPAHDRVVHHHESLAGDVLPKRVQLQPHSEAAHVLAGGDEGPADVPVLDQAVAVREAARTRAKPCAAGTPLSGTARCAGPVAPVKTSSGGIGACSASCCSPMRTHEATLRP